MGDKLIVTGDAAPIRSGTGRHNNRASCVLIDQA
jgi:hypothetical protein